MVFDHMNLSRMHIKIGNKKVPDEAYACDFSPLSLDYLRIYSSFLSVGYKNINVEVVLQYTPPPPTTVYVTPGPTTVCATLDLLQYTPPLDLLQYTSPLELLQYTLPNRLGGLGE
jgi:hypothetical protein